MVKQFLLNLKREQEARGQEMQNVAIVITVLRDRRWQEGHTEYGPGKATLQCGLVKTVKNEVVRLNSRARINTVAPGWINTPLI